MELQSFNIPFACAINAYAILTGLINAFVQL